MQSAVRGARHLREERSEAMWSGLSQSSLLAAQEHENDCRTFSVTTQLRYRFALARSNETALPVVGPTNAHLYN